MVSLWLCRTVCSNTNEADTEHMLISNMQPFLMTAQQQQAAHVSSLSLFQKLAVDALSVRHELAAVGRGVMDRNAAVARCGLGPQWSLALYLQPYTLGTCTLIIAYPHPLCSCAAVPLYPSTLVSLHPHTLAALQPCQVIGLTAIGEVACWNAAECTCLFRFGANAERVMSVALQPPNQYSRTHFRTHVRMYTCSTHMWHT